MSSSMEDFIVEPVRRSMIPKFDEIKSASLASGAVGGGISGSGPSIFMLSQSLEKGNEVAAAMQQVYRTTGIDFNIYVSQISLEGVRVLQ